MRSNDGSEGHRASKKIGSGPAADDRVMQKPRQQVANFSKYLRQHESLRIRLRLSLRRPNALGSQRHRLGRIDYAQADQGLVSTCLSQWACEEPDMNRLQCMLESRLPKDGGGT